MGDLGVRGHYCTKYQSIRRQKNPKCKTIKFLMEHTGPNCHPTGASIASVSLVQVTLAFHSSTF